MALPINRYGYQLVLIGAIIISVIWFFSLEKPPSQKNVYGLSAPYFYRNPQKSIASIRLKVFYVVPKNKVASTYPNWQNIVKPALDDLAKFYTVQLRGLSTIKYDIYPEVFNLEKESIFYDTESTNKGNPEALKGIIEEVERRVPEFLIKEDNEYLVIGIIYEGVGASGTDGVFILARSFLSDQEYRSFSSTLMSHEFGHTLGLPDEYNLDTNQPFSDDIMGGGRRRLIDISYIDAPLLKDMGIIP